MELTLEGNSSAAAAAMAAAAILVAVVSGEADLSEWNDDVARGENAGGGGRLVLLIGAGDERRGDIAGDEAAEAGAETVAVIGEILLVAVVVGLGSGGGGGGGGVGVGVGLVADGANAAFCCCCC
jgi:hypothetical protein